MDTTGPNSSPETSKSKTEQSLNSKTTDKFLHAETVNNPEPIPNSSWPGSELFGSPSAPVKLSTGSGLLTKIISQTRAYIPEYAVLLIVTGTLIGLINGLFSSSVDYIAQPKPHSSWGGGWEYTASLGMLAATLVLIPALVIMTRRIKGTEVESPKVKNLGWRKGFLGIFLVIITLTMLGYLIAGVYQVVSQIAGAGLVAANKAIWKTYIKDAFAILLFGVTTWLYTRDYRSSQDDNDQKHQLLAKLHRYGLTLIAIVLVVVFSATTLSAQRNDYIDNIISNDLDAISTKVSSYETDNNKPAASLSDLKLSDEIKTRVNKYNYEYHRSTDTYKLCAVFRTDTSTQKGDQNSTSLENTLTGQSDYYSPLTPDPSVHGKGRVCFTYTSYASGEPVDSTTYDNFN